MNKYREIEYKFLAKGTFSEAVADVAELLGTPFFQNGYSHDYYWKAKESDFVRLRVNVRPYSSVTLTTKHTDKADSTDRKEINVQISDEFVNETKALLKTSMGPAELKFRQDYYLFKTADGTIVSVYIIDECSQVFIEVEGKNITAVRKWSGRIEDVTEQRIDMSLWDLYLKRRFVI